MGSDLREDGGFEDEGELNGGTSIDHMADNDGGDIEPATKGDDLEQKASNNTDEKMEDINAAPDNSESKGILGNESIVSNLPADNAGNCRDLTKYRSEAIKRCEDLAEDARVRAEQLADLVMDFESELEMLIEDLDASDY